MESEVNNKKSTTNYSKVQNFQQNIVQPATVFIVEKSTLSAINKRATKIFNVIF